MKNTTMLYDEINLPTWALGYVFNGDASGLTDQEEEEVREYFHNLPAHTIDAKDGLFFTNYPAFGLPCTCALCLIYILFDPCEVREEWSEVTGLPEPEEMDATDIELFYDLKTANQC